MRLRIGDRPTDRRIAEPEGGALHLQARRLVGGGAQPVDVGRRGAGNAGWHHVGRMQRGGMRRIDRAFEDLRPVAVDMDLGNGNARAGIGLEHGRLPLRHGFGRTHPDPDKARALAHGIGLVLDLFSKAGACRLGRHLDDIAVHVDLPAMIKAAQAAVLVAPEHQRRTAVRAHFIEHANAALCVAEDHEILAEQADFQGVAIGLRHFLAQAGRQPVMAHDLAHGRVMFDAAQQVVFLTCQHGVLRRALGHPYP